MVDVLDVRHESREVLDDVARLWVPIGVVVQVVAHVAERDLFLAPLLSQFLDAFAHGITSLLVWSASSRLTPLSRGRAQGTLIVQIPRPNVPAYSVWLLPI